MDRGSFLKALPFLQQAAPVWPPRVSGNERRCEVILASQMVSIEPKSVASEHDTLGPSFFAPNLLSDEKERLVFDPAMCKFEAALVTATIASPAVSSASTTMSASQSPKTLASAHLVGGRAELFLRIDHTTHQVDLSQLLAVDISVSTTTCTRQEKSSNHTNPDKTTARQEIPPLPASLSLQFESCLFRVFSLANSNESSANTNDVLNSARTKLIDSIKSKSGTSSTFHLDTPQNSGSSGSSSALSSHEPGQTAHASLDRFKEEEEKEEVELDSPRQQQQKQTDESNQQQEGRPFPTTDSAKKCATAMTRRIQKRKAAFQRSWQGLQSLQSVLDIPVARMEKMNTENGGLVHHFGPLMTTIADDLACSYTSSSNKGARADKNSEVEKCNEIIFNCQINLDEILSDILPAPRTKQRRIAGLNNIASPIKCPDTEEVEDLLQNAKDLIMKQRKAVMSRHMLALEP